MENANLLNILNGEIGEFDAIGEQVLQIQSTDSALKSHPTPPNSNGIDC